MADTGARLVSALSGRYQIGEQIGRGGMATVYSAHDLKHNRSVAIKVLRPELAVALGTERFLREIQVAARLRHPHIIPLFDSGQIPATGDHAAVLYYIMPRIEGESLRNMIAREGALPIPLALKIAGQVADALEHAHRAGVIHRDIKPENILLEEGHALVADFGISRAVKVLREEGPATANLTETGSAVGTPAYMSPEQIEGRPDIDGKSDVYSLACVLYEMLSGKAPFTAPTPTAVAARHLIDPVPHIRQARPEIPAPIEQALLRGMAKSPEDRFATAGDFSAVIREGESGSIPALPRRRSRVMVVALLVLLATVGAWAFFRLSRNAAPTVNTSTLAILPFSVQGPDTLQLGEGMVTLLSNKMDGAGDLRTVDGRALLSYLAMEKPGTLDPARARRIAQHFSAGMFVLGEVVALGPRLQITARLYHQDEDADPTSASEEGDLSSVFEMVDRLAARLLAGRAGGAGNLDQVAGLSTTSLPAFRSFLDGESAMRTGKFDEARVAYVHATEADSTFALAWYRLSVVAQWLGEQDLVQPAARRAQQRSALLPERVRRLLEANIASSNGDLVTAERIYRGITGNYPDDVEAWMQLAELLFHNGPAAGRDSRESRGPWHRVLEYEPHNLIPLIHLARLAAFDRDTAELDSLVTRVRMVRARAGQTTAAARAEELELAMLETVVHQDSVGMERVLADLAQATSLNLAITLWDVAAFTYDFDAARRIAVLLASPSRETGERAVAYGLKGLMSLGQGRWRQALAEFDSADQLTPGLGTSYRAYFLASPFRPVPDNLTEIRQALTTIRQPSTPPPPAASVFFRVHFDIANHARIYLQGLYAALAGDFGSASRSANEVETLPGNEDQRKLSRSFGGGIRAEIALRQGDSAQALRHLLQAREDVSYLLRNTPFYTGMRERYRRGELLERSGRNEEALRWYSTLESQGPADPAYLAPSFLARGRVNEKLNRPDSAAAYYGRMLQLWKNADPEFLPLIEEARAGLNRVSGQR
jgi:serine/threonine-protein kinase